jgi:hypothetical protein
MKTSLLRKAHDHFWDNLDDIQNEYWIIRKVTKMTYREYANGKVLDYARAYYKRWAWIRWICNLLK